MNQTTFLAPCHLRKEYLENSNFDCGESILNDWLFMQSYKNEVQGASRTYIVFTKNKEIAAYFCLSSYSIFHNEAKARLKRNMPNPIPAIMLGRLAVDNKFKGRGLGKSLVSFAIKTAQQAASLQGSVGLVTQPLNEKAKKFYISCGFKPIAENSNKMIFLFN